MVVHKKLVQKSEEWFELKWGKISGTSLGDTQANKNIKDLAIFDRIASEREEEFDPTIIGGSIGQAADRGDDLEPFALEYVSNYLNIEFETFGLIERDDWNVCSPDGLTADLRIGCELKCPSGKVHNSYIRKDVIPRDYIWQIINYFFCIEPLEELHFGSYRPERTNKVLFHKKVTRQSIINTGTDAKPVVMTIQEACDMVAFDMELFKDEIIKFNQKISF